MPRTGSDLFINREISWLEFNARVLEQATDPTVPLLERVKFHAIVSSNLDEFFMVRVAGLKQQISGNVHEFTPDGLSPAEQLAAVSTRAHEIVRAQVQHLHERIIPDLKAEGIELLTAAKLTRAQKVHVAAHYRREVAPTLTPLAVDPGHPFPKLKNRSLNLAIVLHRGPRPRGAAATYGGELIFAVVQVPGVLPRLVEVPTEGTRRAFLFLEDEIALHVGDLFPGFRVLSCTAFRLTRNFDLDIDEEEGEDLLETIQKELRRREQGSAVRLEVDESVPEEVAALLTRSLRLEPDDVYRLKAPLNLADLMAIATNDGDLVHLHDPRAVPQLPSALEAAESMFPVIAEGDVLLHHPYDAFDPVTDLLDESADDPNVLAIKQTLYRTSSDSAIIRALMRAAENGKQVTALVELKARFDEAPNIRWARRLEEAGVHVVYGLLGLKTHCKLMLIVRREVAGLKRYVHLGTGNYNASTARQYTDLSLFTCDESMGEDVGALFNLLTGYSTPPSWKRLAVAPLGLRDKIVELIDAETARGKDGRIIAKVNALVDPAVIRALYRASQAGVEVDLLVRGICCLRPGLAGQSERIRVRSVVDRFLEHARVLCFGKGDGAQVFISSADWMPRNFDRRVEILAPVLDAKLRARMVSEILGVELSDNTSARILKEDGSYARLTGGSVRSQQRFGELARARAQYRPPERVGPPLLRTLPPTVPPPNVDATLLPPELPKVQPEVRPDTKATTKEGAGS